VTVNRSQLRTLVLSSRQADVDWRVFQFRHVVMFERNPGPVNQMSVSCRESEHLERVVRGVLRNEPRLLGGDDTVKVFIRGGAGGLVRTNGTGFGQTCNVVRGARTYILPWHSPLAIGQVIPDPVAMSSAVLRGWSCAPLFAATVADVQAQWDGGNKEPGLQLLALGASLGADVLSHQVRGMANAQTVLTIYADRYDSHRLVAAMDSPAPTILSWLADRVRLARLHPSVVAAAAFCHLLARAESAGLRAQPMLPAGRRQDLGPEWDLEPPLAYLGHHFHEDELEQLQEEEGPDLPMDFDPVVMAAVALQLYGRAPPQPPP
jgi:hypothetical protein